MKNLNKKIIASLVLGGAMIFGSGLAYSPQVSAETNVNVNVQVEQKSQILWTKGSDTEIVAYGISAPDSRGMALAREAAIMSAQRNLLGILQGMQINSETTMRDLLLESDIVTRKISGTLRGAQIVEEGQNPDGSYFVQIAVPMYGASGSIAAAIVPEIVPEEPKPFEVVSNPVVDGSTLPNYTGVVIDASGLDLEPTFSPVIYDTNGRAIYGIENLKPDAIIDNGMVSYSDEVDNEITQYRAGNNPLVVKAVEVRGGKNSANKVNAVISVEDADKILVSNEKTHMLENCAVVFIE